MNSTQAYNRPCAELCDRLKINHQISFAINFLKPLAPCFYESILFIFAASGIGGEICFPGPGPGCSKAD